VSVTFAVHDEGVTVFVRDGDAALDAAATVAGTDQLQGLSSHVMFLARGKAGPFRVDSEPIAGTGGTVAVRVLLYDEGNDDLLITAGSYTFAMA